MSYKKAYLHIFNRLTDIIELVESTDPDTEATNTVPLLKAIQVEAEEICIKR